MPSKYNIRAFKENGFYHVYNRGVAKSEIFLDDQDFKVFIGYMKLYLTPYKNLKEQTLKVAPSRILKNFFEQTILHAYCLMPNHFHLLLQPKEKVSIPLFLKSLITKYSMYFNKKYHRVGPVFQGRYKAVEVDSEEQFVYLSKYIHRNPLPTGSDPVGLGSYKFSSYPNYLGLINQTWLRKDDIYEYFKKINPTISYKNFVEEIDESDLILIKGKILDE